VQVRIVSRTIMTQSSGTYLGNNGLTEKSAAAYRQVVPRTANNKKSKTETKNARAQCRRRQTYTTAADILFRTQTRRRVTTTEVPVAPRLAGVRLGGSGPSAAVTSRRHRPRRSAHTNADRAPRTTAPHQS